MMSKQLAKPATSAFAHGQKLAASHDAALRADPALSRVSLIPLRDASAIAEAAERSLRPANAREILGAIALIAAAWPHAAQRADAGLMDAHLAMMRDDLACYGADVLAETVRRLRRSSKFMPAIAELVALADEITNDLHADRRNARRHLAEHYRRDAAWFIENASDAERAAFVQKLHARLLAAFGDSLDADTGATGAAYEFAARTANVDLLTAVAETPRFLPEMLRHARLIARLQAGPIDESAALQILAVARADIAQAEIDLAAAMQGEAVDGDERSEAAHGRSFGAAARQHLADITRRHTPQPTPVRLRPTPLSGQW